MSAEPAELFDTHCHLFEHGFHGRGGVLLRGPGRELEEYERFRAEYRITRSLVIGYDAGGYAGNSRYIAGLAETRSWMVPLRFAAPGGPFSGAVSAYVADAGAAAALAGALGAEPDPPAILSLNAPPEALAVLEETIRRLESTWVLVSHLGLPGPVGSAREARARLAPLVRLAGLPQVSVKLSGQYAASGTAHPHDDVRVLVDSVADAFGVGALVWGSDFSPCLEAVSLEQAVACLLPAGAGADDRHDILFGNAERSFHRYAGALP